MLIGITQKIIPDRHLATCDSLEQSYLDYLLKQGVTPVPIPNNLEVVKKMLKSIKIEKIIFSGGGDIDPTIYGQKKTKGVLYQTTRDRIETELLNYAKKQKLPVLGICRGMQMINVIEGGKLTLSKNKRHIGTEHAIEITDQAFKNLFQKNQAIVNSYHRFILREEDLGKNLIAFARATDKTIEGFRHRSLPIYGIMWHPERETGELRQSQKFIKAFLSDKLKKS